jgi:hypothetical protein
MTLKYEYYESSSTVIEKSSRITLHGDGDVVELKASRPGTDRLFIERKQSREQS